MSFNKTDETVCAHCGAKSVVYRYNFNKGFARALYKAAKHGPGPFNLSDLKLSNPQYAVFYRMKYWGVIEPVKLEGDRKAGVHQMTQKGFDFLRGKISIPRTCFIRTREAIGFSDEHIYFRDVTDGYEYVEDYKDQVRAQI